MSKERENEIILSLKGRVATAEIGRQFKELFSIRLERYKDTLVKEDSTVTRGKAQELRDMLDKIFSPEP